MGMHPERWQRVVRAYESAIDLPAAQRHDAVAQLCRGDDDVRREVEALLDRDDRPSPLDRGLWHQPAIDGRTPPRLPVGTQLGVYRVEAVLGAGGMGEVYRAHDTKLQRDVALKVLPDVVAHDVARLDRFTREARVLASLNHPNIAAIYGVEDAGDVPALILELVDGPTLDERLRRGPLALMEAVSIALQIAEAVEAAHDSGVVHRDLKPANIKIRPDGTVKVLDFGLAKPIEPLANPGETTTLDAPAATAPDLTDHHTIVGTPAYIAPEQVSGQFGDRRTDVWSFGCVLFEMLTGRRAFRGDSVAEVLRTVARGQMDWSALPAAVPPTLQTLLRRCLEPNRRRRLADFTSVRLDLLHVMSDEGAPEPQRRSPRARTIGSAVAAAWAAIVVTTVVAMLWRADVREPPSASFYLAPPDGWRFTLSGPQAQGGGLAISPDGRHVAFLATNATGERAIWMRTLDRLSAEQLPGTEGAGEAAPFWSPDSRSLGFFADGKLKTIAVSGAPPSDVCDTRSFRGGTWSRNGTIVFATGSRSVLMKVSANGGTPTEATSLAAGEPGHMAPQFLPDGRHFLFYVANFGGIHVASIDSTERAVVIPRPSAATVAYSRQHLLFLRDDTLLAQRFDLRTFSLVGEPAPIAERVFTGNPPVGVFAASDNGVLVFATGAPADSQLTWFDRGGRRTGTIGGTAAYQDVALSPDGNRIAATIVDESRRRGSDIWIVDVQRGFRTRFTLDPGDDGSPVWSPRGDRIAFAARRGRRLSVYQRRATGAGGDELLIADDDADTVPTSWSPDGRHLLYLSSAAGAQRAVWAIPVVGVRTPLRVLANPSTRRVDFSPDGRWIAYTEREPGDTTVVYAAPFPPTGERVRVSDKGGTQPRWRGEEIYYRGQDGTLMAATVRARRGHLDVTGITTLFPLDRAEGVGAFFDVSPSGDRFLVPVATDGREPALAVMTNWNAMIQRRP